MNVMDYLEAHWGAAFTPEQLAVATGTSEHLTRVILREAGDRDWAEKLPDGRWRIP